MFISAGRAWGVAPRVAVGHLPNISGHHQGRRYIHVRKSGELNIDAQKIKDFIGQGGNVNSPEYIQLLRDSVKSLISLPEGLKTVTEFLENEQGLSPADVTNIENVEELQMNSINQRDEIIQNLAEFYALFEGFKEKHSVDSKSSPEMMSLIDRLDDFEVELKDKFSEHKLHRNQMKYNVVNLQKQINILKDSVPFQIKDAVGPIIGKLDFIVESISDLATKKDLNDAISEANMLMDKKYGAAIKELSEKMESRYISLSEEVSALQSKVDKYENESKGHKKELATLKEDLAATKSELAKLKKSGWGGLLLTLGGGAVLFVMWELFKMKKGPHLDVLTEKINDIKTEDELNPISDEYRSSEEFGERCLAIDQKLENCQARLLACSENFGGDMEGFIKKGVDYFNEHQVMYSSNSTIRSLINILEANTPSGIAHSSKLLVAKFGFMMELYFLDRELSDVAAMKSELNHGVLASEVKGLFDYSEKLGYASALALKPDDYDEISRLVEEDFQPVYPSSSEEGSLVSLDPEFVDFESADVKREIPILPVREKIIQLRTLKNQLHEYIEAKDRPVSSIVRDQNLAKKSAIPRTLE